MRLSIAALGLVLTACYSSDKGIAPPLDRIYFPVGLSTDCDPRPGAPSDCQATYLYVASSDFDLQYNAGSLQVLDLKRVRGLVPRACVVDADCGGEMVCDNAEWAQAHPLDANTPRPPSFFCVAPSGSYEDEPCGAIGQQTLAERATVPGPCLPVDLLNPPKAVDGTEGPLIVQGASVQIGAFATDILMTTGPEGTDTTSDPNGKAKRLLIPVRGEASLHWLDIKPNGKVDCGQTDGSPVCDKRHRVGTEPTENTRGVKMPPEPYGIAASDEGDAILVTHQTQGALSLFYQKVTTPRLWEEGPKLEFVYSLPASAAIAIASTPEPKYVRGKRLEWLRSNSCRGVNVNFDAGSYSPCPTDPFPPGFLVAYANAAEVDLVRVYADSPASPARPFIQGAAAVPIRANAGDNVSRGIAFDDTEMRACDEGHGKAYDDCGKQCKATNPAGDAEQLASCVEQCCAKMSVGVYVANRSPATLLVGRVIPGIAGTDSTSPAQPSRDVPRFEDVVAAPLGPSRVYTGKVIVADGSLETRVFMVCYDQRRIIVYDPKREVIESYIITGRGPHAMAFDFYPGDDKTPARALAYVGHFFDSYLGVIDLDQRHIQSYGSIVLSIGQPTAPRAQK
jgi:hypothetical protein